MRNRTLLYCLVGFILAAVLIVASTNFAAGNRHTSQAWVLAQQKTPLLWMVDGCALIILMGSWLLGVAISGLQESSRSQSDTNARHIEVLTHTIQDLFEQNSDYASRLEALEEDGNAWHEGFDEEARRLTEQAFLALSDNIESNALQLEAVNLALRYQRAEMQSVRTAFKTGALQPPPGSPPPLDPVDRPFRPVLPEWRRSEQAELMAASDVERENSAIALNEADEETQPEQPSLIQDQTINARTTVVETLDFDAANTAVVGSRESMDTAAKSTLASEEFRRSRQEPKSIFRQKRR